MLNKVTLIGRLGNDPEVRHMPNGNPVANISIATSRRWKDKQSDEKREETEWHRIVCFNRLAEIVGEHLKKGSMIYIEGRIRTNKWQDQSGQDRFTTEIVAEQMTMLDRKNDSTSGQPSSPQQSAPQQQAPTGQPFDDDLPF